MSHLANKSYFLYENLHLELSLLRYLLGHIPLESIKYLDLPGFKQLSVKK